MDHVHAYQEGRYRSIKRFALGSGAFQFVMPRLSGIRNTETRPHSCLPHGPHARFRALPFRIEGSGSSLIFCPFNSLLFNRLNATATSDNSAISTTPNPRHTPEARSVTASAPTTSPARAKCACRSRLVTEPARLPTYTLGINKPPVFSKQFGRSRQVIEIDQDRLRPRASKTILYRSEGKSIWPARSNRLMTASDYHQGSKRRILMTSRLARSFHPARE